MFVCSLAAQEIVLLLICHSSPHADGIKVDMMEGVRQREEQSAMIKKKLKKSTRKQLDSKKQTAGIALLFMAASSNISCCNLTLLAIYMPPTPQCSESNEIFIRV